MKNPPPGMKAVRPGDEIHRLLEAADGDESVICGTLAAEPEYWMTMLAFGIPWLLIYRQKDYCKSQRIKPEPWTWFT